MFFDFTIVFEILNTVARKKLITFLDLANIWKTKEK